MKTVYSEFAKAKERIERYLLAFESDCLPKLACGQRIRKPTARILELTAAEPALGRAGTRSEDPTTEVELAQLRSQVRDAIEEASSSVRNALVQQVRMNGRETIVPYFKLPTQS